ncbi:hypothetical protein LCGC14_0884430 [marine sediment metagenome]|uniref:Uncharacterized protein n=1 Tax=marine sediment metagenome TaxID=412755 RepID=A0A0F9S7Z2_9ZZZZ
MKIILINPDTHTKYPQPPLGLLSLATVLKQAGHGVKILDMNHLRESKEVLFHYEMAEVVGITSTSISYEDAEFCANLIRRKFPRKFLIIGGIHATLKAKEIMDDGIFDAVICGEGETTLQLAVDLQEKGIYHQRNNVDINSLPILDYSFLNGFKPKIPRGRHQKFMPMITSRGCPFSCSFCSKAVFGNKYRTRDIDLVMAEIDILRRDYGVNNIKFYDDVFTLEKDRAVELSQRINNSVAWSCMTRVNLVDRYTLNQMRRGGCYSIAFGLESGNAEVLKEINKNTTKKEAEDAVRYAKEAGMNVIGYFMLGCPGETKQTIIETIDWAVWLGLDHAQFSIATALPGSELYEHLPSANSYCMNGQDNPSLCELTPQELKEYQKVAETTLRMCKR